MIRIVTDSTASIPHEWALASNIEVVTLYVNRDGVEYEDATMDLETFYSDIYDMVDDIPKSSQPSQGKLESLFEEIANAGDELLGVFMSSKMSGSLEGALRAARSVAARSAFAAAAGRDLGYTLDRCVDMVKKSICATRWLFTPESLRFLKAGGRIGTASALLGTFLQICPVLTVTDGETATFAKVRTQKKALAAIAKKLKADVEQYGLKNLVVHYIGSPDAAARWAHDVIEPIAKRDVPVIPVSACIGYRNRIRVRTWASGEIDCQSGFAGVCFVGHVSSNSMPSCLYEARMKGCRL